MEGSVSLLAYQGLMQTEPWDGNIDFSIFTTPTGPSAAVYTAVTSPGDRPGNDRKLGQEALESWSSVDEAGPYEGPSSKANFQPPYDFLEVECRM